MARVPQGEPDWPEMASGDVGCTSRTTLGSHARLAQIGMCVSAAAWGDAPSRVDVSEILHIAY